MYQFQNPFKDMIKYFEPVDFNQFKDMAYKNIENAVSANQVLIDGMQEVAKRVAATSQKNAQNIFECMKHCMLNPSQDSVQKCQTQALKELSDNNANAAKEIFQITSKVMEEMLTEYNKKMSQFSKEVNNTAKKAE